MTPSQALSLIRNQINETTANYWSDAEIYSYMWQAEKLLAPLMGYAQAVTAHTTVTDQSVYTVPDNSMDVVRVTFDGKKLKKVEAIDIDNLDGTTAGSTIQSGKPEVYKIWGGDITVYPTPDDANGAEPLYMEFLKTPTEITAASPAFTLSSVTGREYIPDYAIYRCLKKAKENEANDYYTIWNNNLIKARDLDDKDEDMYVRDEDEYPGGSLGMD